MDHAHRDQLDPVDPGRATERRQTPGNSAGPQGFRKTAFRRMNVVAMQRAAGNAAVASLLTSTEPVVQRDNEKKPLDEVLAGKDPSLLKPHIPFTSITIDQGRKICRLVIDHSFLWVGRSDEVMLEEAWRALSPHRDTLTEQDWALWKECADHGANIKYVPWLRDLQTSFADKVREQAQRNVDANLKLVEAEAKRLGLGLNGAPEPAATPESNAAVAEQQKLAKAMKEVPAKLTALRGIAVGYGPPQPGAERDQKSSPVAGTPDPLLKPLVTFDAEHAPHSRPTPDPNPELGMANYETILAVHNDLVQTSGRILDKNPALFAMRARGSTDSLIDQDAAGARRSMTAALQDVLDNAATTKANIESRSLSFASMTPVHHSVSATDPLYQKPFPKKAAADYLKEEADDAAAGAKLVTLVTLALIAAVEIGTAGAATPVIGAVISLAASTGTAAASWNEWDKKETGAKSAASNATSIVDQGQADDAKMEALVATAMALIDVYGAAKAGRAATAAAQQAAKAVESRVGDVAKMRGLAQGATAGAKEAIERSVVSLGPATTVRNVGSWEKIVSTVGTTDTMVKLSAWRDTVFKQAETIALKATGASKEDAARAALAVASGLEQAVLGEALDAVIEIIGGPDEPSSAGHIGIGGGEATLPIEAVAAQVPTVASRAVQRRVVEVVNVPISELRLGTMSPAEFEEIIRTGVASGYFRAQGLPRMTVIDAKLHGGGHGYDGLGISKQGDNIKLYNLECKHVVPDSKHVPSLDDTNFGTQGGLRWNEAKAKAILSAENEFAEDTYDLLQKAVRRRLGPGVPFSDHMLEQALAGALRTAPFHVFTPVWANADHLLAQMRGLARSGLTIGKLFRIAPRRR